MSRPHWSAIASAARWPSPPPTGCRSSASRRSPRHGISRPIPNSSRAALTDLWNGVHAAADAFGRLPMEVLQAAFWALDPDRTVAKFARFSKLDPEQRGSAAVRGA